MWSVFALLCVAGVAGGRTGSAVAQEASLPSRAATSSALRAELLYRGSGASDALSLSSSSGRRAVPLAFALSAVAPGAGQAYNRQWIKAGVAAAMEAALITGYVTWRQRGIDGRAAYEVYAQQYWSPTRYATWLNEYSTFLEEADGATIGASRVDPGLIEAAGAIDFGHADAWSRQEQTTVRQLFDQIRSLESSVYHIETGASFSHKLPYFAEQQYYELIGKYFQFAPGWSDYPVWMTEDGEIIRETIDPERTGPDGSKPNVQGRFLDYAEAHGDAQGYLRKASRLSLLFIANHFIAAIDAALFAKLHNDRLQTSMGLAYGPDGAALPVARVQVRL